MIYIFLSFLLSFKSFAWQEPLPEYSGMTLEDPSRIEKSELISSEYQTDLLSYDPPISWHYNWISHPNAMNVALGSLSGKYFYLCYIDHQTTIYENQV